MYIVTQPIRVRSRRKVYLPHERVQVNGVGLGEDLSGFHIGKMFKNLVKITPRSFQPKNIFGAIGSAAAFTSTMGMSSALAPKLFSAHSKTMKIAGMAVAAVAGTVLTGGALATAFPALGAGIASAGSAIASGAGSLFSGAGSLLMSGGGGLLRMFGGGGGSTTPQEYPPGYGGQGYQIPQQPQQYYDPMVAYNENVARSAGAPLGGGIYSSMPNPSQADYNQPGTELQSPDKYNLQDPSGSMIDPRTGQVIPQRVQEMSMIPNLSGTTWLILGGVTLAGWYLLSDSKKEIGNA